MDSSCCRCVFAPGLDVLLVGAGLADAVAQQVAVMQLLPGAAVWRRRAGLPLH